MTAAAIPCKRSNARQHPSTCVCRGTGWVFTCEACSGTGYNGKLQKVCGPCGGRGAIMANSPNRPFKEKPE